jgi:hypothetical protein
MKAELLLERLEEARATYKLNLGYAQALLRLQTQTG